MTLKSVAEARHSASSPAFDVHRHALGLEAAPESARQPFVVLDDQHPHGRQHLPGPTHDGLVICRSCTASIPSGVCPVTRTGSTLPARTSSSGQEA